MRGRPHFQRTTEFDSIEGKKNSVGLRFKAEALEWFGLRLPILHDPVDRKAWQAEALRRSTKFCRVLRRRVRGVDRWYLLPTRAGRAVAAGPCNRPRRRSTLALHGGRGGRRALLAPLCPGVVQPWKEMKRLERAMDRSRRATSPDNFDRRGRAKKGARKWKRSRRYQRLAEKRRERERRLAAERKRVHGELANRIVGQGNVVVAFRKSFSRSVKVRAPGALVAVLRQKTAATGGDLMEFPTRTTRLSQYDHTTGAYMKKPLSQRVHVLGDGSGVVQRDLYSAFLARFVEADTLDARYAAEAFRNAKPLLLRAAPGEQHEPASGVGFPHTLWRVQGCPSKRICHARAPNT